MRRFLCGLMALGLLVGLARQGEAQATFAFTRLDPGSFFDSDTAYPLTGISSSGQIVGWYAIDQTTEYSFLFEKGGYTTLMVPGSTDTFASGINDSGQIVGYYTDAGFNQHGFLLDQGSYTTNRRARLDRVRGPSD